MRDGYGAVVKLLLALVVAMSFAGLGAPAAGAAEEPVPAAADTATVAPGDSLAVLRPPVPDFFDTGISGTTAVLMTPVMPGWGQLYAGNGWRAALAFGLEWYYWSNLLAHDRQASRVGEYSRTLEPGGNRDFFAATAAEEYQIARDYAWWSGGAMLIMALDAYVGAKLFGFDHEALPMPDQWDKHPAPELPEPVGSHHMPTVTLWCWCVNF